MVVSRALADRFWPGTSAVGKHLKPVWIPKWATIVGVVANVRYEGLAADRPSQDFYMPLAQWGVGSVTAVLQSPLRPAELERMLRSEVKSVDPSATVNQVRTMEAVVLASAAQPRTTTSLIGVFALLALLLGTIGVYGVLSYGVTQRRREIGIRMAIDAEPGRVRTMVLG